MPYSPATVANYFLDKASQEARALTPMQLIKLVYIAHGWHLGYFGQPLINEQIQAWKYGPVVESLYQRLKHYGSGAVREPVRDGPFRWSVPSPEQITGSTAELLDSVWKHYAQFSGVQLSAMTHLAGTPWYQAWHEQGGRSQSFALVNDEIIKRYYKQRIASTKSGKEHKTEVSAA
jgi:uncharacterized phage-associated protein